jgi:hypothetical protein
LTGNPESQAGCGLQPDPRNEDLLKTFVSDEISKTSIATASFYVKIFVLQKTGKTQAGRGL